MCLSSLSIVVVLTGSDHFTVFCEHRCISPGRFVLDPLVQFPMADDAPPPPMSAPGSKPPGRAHNSPGIFVLPPPLVLGARHRTFTSSSSLMSILFRNAGTSLDTHRQTLPQHGSCLTIGENERFLCFRLPISFLSTLSPFPHSRRSSLWGDCRIPGSRNSGALHLGL